MFVTHSLACLKARGAPRSSLRTEAYLHSLKIENSTEPSRRFTAHGGNYCHQQSRSIERMLMPHIFSSPLFMPVSAKDFPPPEALSSLFRKPPPIIPEIEYAHMNLYMTSLGRTFSKEDIIRARNLAHQDASIRGCMGRIINENWNLLYYGFCFADSIVLNNPATAVASLLHMCVEISRISKHYSDVLHNMIQTVYLCFNQSILMENLHNASTSFTMGQYRAAMEGFFSSLPDIAEIFNFEAWIPRFKIGSALFESTGFIFQFRDLRTFIFWILQKLREALIHNKMWPAL